MARGLAGLGFSLVATGGTAEVIMAKAILHQIPYITTIRGARAAVLGLSAWKDGELTVKPIQEYHAG